MVQYKYRQGDRMMVTPCGKSVLLEYGRYYSLRGSRGGVAKLIHIHDASNLANFFYDNLIHVHDLGTITGELIMQAHTLTKKSRVLLTDPDNNETTMKISGIVSTHCTLLVNADGKQDVAQLMVDKPLYFGSHGYTFVVEFLRQRGNDKALVGFTKVDTVSLTVTRGEPA